VCVAGASERNIASGQQSDHLLMAAVYEGWTQAAIKVHHQKEGCMPMLHSLL
jgi:hypothetical protein